MRAHLFAQLVLKIIALFGSHIPLREGRPIGLFLLQLLQNRLAIALASPRLGPGSREGPERLARGIAAHDLYHAGQIQLLKRLRPARRKA